MSARGPVALAHGLIILLCIWLFITPWVLKYTDAAGWNATIVAAIIAAAAAYRFVRREDLESTRWLSWVMIILGLWLIIAPWIISAYEENNEKWNSVIVGALIAILAYWGSRAESPATT
ncbi:MAG: hypothetical protein C4346_01835 [Chloroflexota bacterium]